MFAHRESDIAIVGLSGSESTAGFEVVVDPDQPYDLERIE
jgi:hypothetical protein